MSLMAGLVILAALVATSNEAFAGNNLLVNGNFNVPASTATATGWTPWTYSNNAGDSWANHQNIVYTYGGSNNILDGSYYIAVGGDESGTSGGGMYQIVSGVPGFTYNLTVKSAVQNWWWPEGEMRIFFLDVSNNILSESVSNVTTAITGYDLGLPWTSYSMSATAPAGTTQVKVELASQSGTGTVFFDNASLTSAYDAPTINNVFPNGYTLLQYTNALTFTAASDTTGISPGGIQVTLNGSNVSAGLVISGGPFSYNVSYPGLKSNQVCSASIAVTDTNGIETSASYAFDTYGPTLLWEAEDFDFTNGLYINNPTLTSASAPNSYFGVVGVPQVDELDLDGNPPGTGAGPEIFRPGDPISTSVAGDTPRQNFVNAQLLNTNIQDYSVGYFDGSDWVNYTRNFPTGKYYVYGRVATGSAGAISLGIVTNGRGTAGQTTNTVGAFQIPNLGWGTYSYVPLTDIYGNLAVLSLGGVTALRVNAANAGGNMNFFFVVPANTSTPIITNIYPSGVVLFQPTNQFTFRVYSPVGNNINTNSIHFSLNGISISNLVESGASSSWIVGYSGLKTNAAYTAVINVTDVDGNSSSATVVFDTYNPRFTWEAEDWDFSGGVFIDNPVLASSPQPNSYFARSGTQGVDENTLDDAQASLATAGADYLYRPSDAISTGLAEDTARQTILNAQAGNPSIQDYMLGWFNPGEWVNYTRTFPAGTYNIYVRAAYGGGGNSSSIYLDQITSGRGTAAQAIAHVGSFTIPAAGWTTYSYVPCVDRFGNIAQVTLGGVATFRLTAGSANVNFFMLVPARTDLPRIATVYPDGTTLLQGTNKFAFTVLASTSPGTAISTANISMTLNGSNAPLTFTASGQNWNATTPLVANVTNYTAIINAMDNASNSVTATVYFDTFSGSSFVWEAEDYDYNSGQYIDNPVPTSAPAAQSYFGLDGNQGIDYNYVNVATGSLFLYRPDDFIATDYCPDTPLQKYVTARLADPTIQDFYVGWWATNSWINYTRTYPSGNFNMYGRLSGAGGVTYNVQLSKMSGAVSNYLGTFSYPGRGYNLYDWVPLVNNGTNVVVSLGGVTTLRATAGGDVNANRYILVTPAPAAGVPVRITVSVSGGNVQLSYPTQSGHNYVIEYKTTLKDASWTPLATYSGDGTVQSHLVGTATGTTRFYLVVTQ
jgi:hypothetical protein